MLNSKWMGAVLLAATAASSAAMADERGVNTVVGATLGAAIGHSNGGGREGAIVGGLIGAALGSSASTRDDRTYTTSYAAPRNVTYVEVPRVRYVEARRYEPAPVYVEPVFVVERAPRYVAAQPVVYIDSPHYYRSHRHYYHNERRDGYRDGFGH
jgi:hypothetical protein